MGPGQLGVAQDDGVRSRTVTGGPARTRMSRLIRPGRVSRYKFEDLVIQWGSRGGLACVCRPTLRGFNPCLARQINLHCPERDRDTGATFARTPGSSWIQIRACTFPEHTSQH